MYVLATLEMAFDEMRSTGPKNNNRRYSYYPFGTSLLDKHFAVRAPQAISLKLVAL